MAEKLVACVAATQTRAAHTPGRLRVVLLDCGARGLQALNCWCCASAVRLSARRRRTTGVGLLLPQTFHVCAATGCGLQGKAQAGHCLGSCRLVSLKGLCALPVNRTFCARVIDCQEGSLCAPARHLSWVGAVWVLFPRTVLQRVGLGWVVTVVRCTLVSTGVALSCVEAACCVAGSSQPALRFLQDGVCLHRTGAPLAESDCRHSRQAGGCSRQALSHLPQTGLSCWYECMLMARLLACLRRCL